MAHAENRDAEPQPRAHDPLSLCLSKLLDPGLCPREPVPAPPAPTPTPIVTAPAQVPPAEAQPVRTSSIWQRAKCGAARTLRATTLPRRRREAGPSKTVARSLPTVSRAKPTTLQAAERYSHVRQKVMMTMIPALALTLVFLLKNPLKSSSAAETAPAPAHAAASMADLDTAIAWAIPPLYQPGGRDPMRLPAPPGTETVEGPALEPVPTHVELAVTGILYSLDRPSAIVDTHLVREGQQVSGATVRKIDADGVEFEMNGQTWRQTVNRQ